MKKTMLMSIIILGMMILSGCDQLSNQESDNAIQDTVQSQNQQSEASQIPQISQKDLENGWYYGFLDQKKPGTPDNWVHSGEGTKSAKWYLPKSDN